ncbi:MAG: KamA family radical SAM protein [Candidatus Omnitrophica bacterium]|nr:KamA family radical SAM protein [Candidatus Omnitrophota bacterium]
MENEKLVKKTEQKSEEPPEPNFEEPPSTKLCLKEIPSSTQEVRHPIASIEALAKYLPLNEQVKIALKQVIKSYQMLITPYYLSLIKDVMDPHDPIRRQCVPSLEEIRENEHETMDPLAEEKTSVTPFLVHRYPDRALLLVTGRCFMYCRHCTRKRLWKAKNAEPSLREIDQALRYVKDKPQIREIIVSGGDPLTLHSERLDYILSAIRQIKSVEVMRIGTRTPVVNPQRIDAMLCRILEKYENLWINVQFNHPAEVTPQAAEACRKLQRCGIPLSNQAVLLKGVNDNPDVMKQLMQKLQAIRVRPYYLYQCDPVVGANHFRTSVYQGIEIIEKLRGHTSGMCIPTFVVDGTEGKGKIPLGPNYLISLAKDQVTLRNYKNEVIQYYNPQG